MNAELRRLGGLEYSLLFIVFTIAAGVRVGYVRLCASNASTSGPFQVQESNHADWTALVETVSRDAGYAVPGAGDSPALSVAHPAPLYAGMLAGLRRLSADLADAERWARWLQCGFGAATAALLFLFSRRAFHSNAVAAVAGLAAAVHPFWVASTAEIQDGVQASFLLAACLFLGARASQSRGALTSWAFGLALAGLSLTRAPLLVFAVIALLWFLECCAHLERGWLLAVLACLGFALGLGPWMVRNYLVFHDVYPVVDNGIYHLWLGNRAADSSETIVPEAQGSDAERLREIWDGLGRQPSAFLERRIRAGLHFWLGKEWFGHGRLCIVSASDDPSSTVPSWVNRSYASLFAGSLLALTILGMLGWRCSYPWRTEAMPLALALFWVPFPYVLSHAENLSGPRLPLDGVLICYAAYGLVWSVISLGQVLCCRGFGCDVER